MQFIHELQDWWRGASWFEIIGAITGFLCVYLASVNNIWNWPIAIISTALYVYVFGQKGFYADMLQYVYLCVMSMYGWWFWSRHPQTDDKAPVLLITRKQIIISALIVIVATPVLGYTLITFAAKLHYDPPAYPYLDSFCTSCSLVAQVFLARKVLENWVIWFFVDIIYVVMYFKKGLEFTSFLFIVYIIIAVNGYFDWRRDYRKQLA
ncbi:MAG: nicotinamide mononucleotide transporter [Bacteroidetes bacterium]|nr:nicotinamide mononucleotide transporter [Bacteroidota bacterium]